MHNTIKKQAKEQKDLRTARVQRYDMNPARVQRYDMNQHANLYREGGICQQERQGFRLLH